MVHQTNMKNHGFTGGASFGLAYTIVWRIHPKPRRCDEQPFVIEQLYPCTSQEWLWSGFRDINPIAASSPSYRFLLEPLLQAGDRKSTRLNSSHQIISYAVFCLKKKKHVHAAVAA